MNSSPESRSIIVILLVEVAENSYRYDRYVKVPLYARARIPEAWIVDLLHGTLEVFRAPGPTGYASALRVERGGSIAPSAFPNVIVAVDEILPP